MAAQKSRFYKTDTIIWDAGSDTVTVEWKSDGTVHDYKLSTLSGGELRTVCAAVFGPSNTGDATNESRLAALRAEDATLLTSGTDDAPQAPKFPEAEGETAPEPAPTTAPEPAPQPTPAPTSGDPMAVAFDMLRAAMAGAIDESKVRTIVEAAVMDATKNMRPTVVKVGEAPEVRLKGRPHKSLPEVLKATKAGLIPYLVGPAGTGKSSLAQQVAEALELPFGEISTEPTMSAVALKGYNDANGQYVTTEFRTMYGGGGVFLLDEVDNGHPSVVKGMNAALGGNGYSFADGRVEKHADFYAMAAANTFGNGANRQYVGASQLDASTLDRFFTIEVDYDEALEREIGKAVHGSKGEAWAIKVQTIRANQVAAGLRVIVSTRAVEKGARALAAGFTEREAFDRTVGAGQDRSTVEKLLAKVSLAA